MTTLVTGCSTGIGRSLALDLTRRGIPVLATARRLADLAPLEHRGIQVAALDIDSSDSRDRLVASLKARGLSVDLLINNAGFGAMGPIAEMPVDELKRQFETNVFSLVALTQLLLPDMIARRSGCIVNIGSVSGVTTTPFAGAYCASKAAVHALTDALRMELAPFGIRVVTAQPGAIRSQFGANATVTAGGDACPQGSLYASLRGAIDARAKASQIGGMSADQFAQRLLDAVLGASPPVVFRAGRHSVVLPALSRWLPKREVDRLLSRRFGLDRLGR